MPKKGFFIIVGPWILYLFIILLFNIEFEKINIIVFLPIILAIFLSMFFFFLGFKNSYNKIQYHDFISTKKNFIILAEPLYIKQLVILALIGCVFNLYFDIVRTINNEMFRSLTDQDANFLYSIRISKNTSAELIGSNFQFISKALYSLSFFFYIYKLTKKYIFYQWIIIILSLINCLLTGGRFYILYYLIIFITSKAAYNNVKISNYFTFKNFIIFLIIFYGLLLSFSLRAPGDFDILNYYKYTNGIKSIALEYVDFGIFDELKNSLLILIIHITQSLYFFSMHYDLFGFSAYAYGGYTFNLPVRIINTIFNFNLSPIQDYYGVDYTIGRYSTFAKSLISDFGIIGMLVFNSFCSYMLGISTNYKDLYFSYRIIYYWLLVFFLMAPMFNLIQSGYINIMFIYLIFYKVIEVRKKRINGFNNG